MIKTNGRKIIPVLAILWMMVIFMFSAQPADESTETSLFIGQMVETVCVPGFVDFSSEEKRVMAENIDFFVRKTAHAAEYAVLGLLLSLSAGELLELSFFERQRIAYVFGTVYAATDEFHQLFVPGRAGMVRDVILDSAGVLVGVMSVYAFKRITGKRSSRRRLSVA